MYFDIFICQWLSSWALTLTQEVGWGGGWDIHLRRSTDFVYLRNILVTKEKCFCFRYVFLHLVGNKGVT